MKILDYINKFFLFIAEASLLICVFLTTINAAGRYIIKSPITGAYEFTELFLMVSIVFFSLVYTWEHGGFIAVTFISDKFSFFFKNLSYFLILILSILFFFVIGYTEFIEMWGAWIQKQTTSGVIPWPKYISFMMVPIGSLLMIISMAREVAIGTKNLFNKGLNHNLFKEVEPKKETKL